MKILTPALAALVCSAAVSAASPKVGMLVSSDYTASPQEVAAAEWFTNTYTDGKLLTISDLAEITPENFKAIWVHIDRCGIGMGYDNLPADYKSSAVKEVLTDYAKSGGALYLSKFATQMVHELDRLDAAYAPGIFGDGDGGVGTDVWCVNAYLGSMQTYIDNADPTQIYDRTSHSIYDGMEAWDAHSEQIADYPHPAFPLLGTGTGEGIHREDHNCMWDLNAYSWTADGKNTLEKFENQYNCTVLGTWGHVQDYCVAGIVEFNPDSEYKGTIIANGLAACEWAPRTANNAYHSNLTRLTENTLDYLAATNTSAVASIESEQTGVAEWYTVDGVKTLNPSNGLYIMVRDGKATKVLIK